MLVSSCSCTVYIDDTLFCGPDIKTIKDIKAAFMKHWECKDLGPADKFLHMNIRPEGSKIMINQCAYLENIENYSVVTEEQTTVLNVLCHKLLICLLLLWIERVYFHHLRHKVLS